MLSGDPNVGRLVRGQTLLEVFAAPSSLDASNHKKLTDLMQWLKNAFIALKTQHCLHLHRPS